mmetsp:Transcript_25536/g.55608  ORF Transcript_25536/g.55608 Transcript_25536/m.55608 type:complete len:229 (+) Transcript_25536:412-1098(+)
MTSARRERQATHHPTPDLHHPTHHMMFTYSTLFILVHVAFSHFLLTLQLVVSRLEHRQLEVCVPVAHTREPPHFNHHLILVQRHTGKAVASCQLLRVIHTHGPTRPHQACCLHRVPGQATGLAARSAGDHVGWPAGVLNHLEVVVVAVEVQRHLELLQVTLKVLDVLAVIRHDVDLNAIHAVHSAAVAAVVLHAVVPHHHPPGSPRGAQHVTHKGACGVGALVVQVAW